MVDEGKRIGVRVNQSGAVATVTLTRPALGTAAKSALRDALAQLAADDSVRVVVLTGTGKTFCAGQDLAEHAQTLSHDPGNAFATITEHYNPIVLALATMPKPVIAAINGTCVGAGLGFALACDLRVISDSARFGTAFAAIGLTPDSGLSATLAHAVGTARAAELILLGETFTAEQAVAWGIAGQVVPAEQVHDTSAAIADRLAAGPTRAYAEAKRALAVPLSEALRSEGEAQARLGLTQDHQRAVAAFLAKEKPSFAGQ
jgi:2-(1,2-epoxy-1,2-dihydrophenyl)acetyl-CoA isomerase